MIDKKDGTLLSNPVILFRADGNSNIGMGHIMRCLSIADALRGNGATKCKFLLSDEGLFDLISSRGYEGISLDSAYDKLEEELESVKDQLRGAHALIIDSYYVTPEYLADLHETCKENNILLVYMDDVYAFPYECDALINYDVHATKEKYKKLYGGELFPHLILGTDYVPLREEFQNLDPRRVKEDARDVLISTGGADSEHMSLTFAREIMDRTDGNDVRFHMVIGAMNRDREELFKLTRDFENIILHENVTKMSELMCECDVAISAAGSTLYELCTTQTPTVTYILAENQITGTTAFEDKGIMKNAGDIRALGAKQLANHALDEAMSLLNDYHRRTAIAETMKTIIDGAGANRIAKEILKF